MRSLFFFAGAILFATSACAETLLAGVDIDPILALVPARYLGLVQALLCAIGLASAICPWLPPASDPNSAYGRALGLVNKLGQNFRNASNATSNPQSGFIRLHALFTLAVLSLALAGCAQITSAINGINATLSNPAVRAEFASLCAPDGQGQKIKSALWTGLNIARALGVSVPDWVDPKLTEASSDFDGLCAIGLPADATQVPVKLIAAVQTFQAIHAAGAVSTAIVASAPASK